MPLVEISKNWWWYLLCTPKNMSVQGKITGDNEKILSTIIVKLKSNGNLLLKYININDRILDIVSR